MYGELLVLLVSFLRCRAHTYLVLARPVFSPMQQQQGLSAVEGLISKVLLRFGYRSRMGPTAAAGCFGGVGRSGTARTVAVPRRLYGGIPSPGRSAGARPRLRDALAPLAPAAAQRLAVTTASTADAPPQVSCGRDGTGRTGRTTKAMCGRAGSLRPAQGQGDQGRAANCCALREAGQGLGTIELRGGGITGSEVSTFCLI